MTSRRHRAADITRGLSALLVLTAVTAGLPVALYLVAGSPLPHAAPGLHQIAAALGRRDDGTLFLSVVRYIAWAAWAAWTVSALGEVYGQTRGRTIRLAGLGGSRALVAAILIAFSPAAPAALAAAPAAVPAAAAAPWPGTPAAAGGGHVVLDASTRLLAAGVRPAAARTVTVRPGDCLWTIAARYLGSGDKYPEIAALNQGRDMGGGQRFTDPALIRPGWVLRLPASASPPAGADPAAAPRHPGHPSASPSFARPHPAASSAPSPAVQDPDTSPAAFTPAQAAPAAASPAAAPSRSQLPDALIFTSGLLSGGIIVTLTRLRHRQRQQRRPGRRIALPESPVARRAERAIRTAHGPRQQAAAIRAALATLASGLRRGRMPLPAAAGIHLTRTELDVLLTEPAPGPPAPFTVAPDSRDMCWRLPAPVLDALPGADGTGAGDLLPGLVSAGETGDGHLLLDLEAPGVTTVDGSGGLADQFLLTAAVELATNPWAGSFDLLLEGFPELAAVSDRAQACASLDEAISVLEDRARGIPPGTRPGEARQNRLSDPASPDWTLTLLAARTVPSPGQMARLLDAAAAGSGVAALVPGDPAAPDGREAPASLDLRRDPDGGVTATVHPLGLAITPRMLDDSAYRALSEIFAAARAPDVSPASPPYLDEFLPAPASRGWPHAADGAGGGPPLYEEDGPLLYEEDEYDGEDSGPGGQEYAGAAEPLPALNGQQPAPRSASAAPGAGQQEEGIRISVLGPLAITGTADELQPKQAELVVALALAGEPGLSNEALRGMLGTDEDHPKPPDSLRQIITRTRRKLGTAPDGGEYVIHAGNAQYVLHPAASLDWHDFRALADDGREHRDPRPLRAAVNLLRGQPMDGLYYWWVDTTLLETMRAEIVDAAALLASLELDAGDPAAAGRAARAGLAADTAAEQLWRALMRAEDAAANTAGVHDAWQHCLTAISGIAADGEPHPDTTALYRKLTGRRGGR